MKIMDPALVQELVDPSDRELSPGSNVAVRWRCRTDPRHLWTATPNTRRRSPGCPVCLNKIIIAGVNDLATTHPELAAQLYDPDLATTVHAGSHAPVEWCCPDDTTRPPSHRWHASVVSRTRRGSGCPFCSGRRPVPGLNDLATTHPDVAALLVDPALATTVGAGSSKRLAWRCEHDPDHTWTTQVRYRTGVAKQRPTSCPHCSNRGERREHRHPTLGELRHPLLEEAVDPASAADLSLGSGKPVRWHCPTCGGGHSYTASVRHRLRGQGCPVIAGREVMAGVNDLATTP